MPAAQRRPVLLTAALLALALVASLLSACGSAAPASPAPAAGFPTTIGTGAGPVTVTRRPTAIVSLSAPSTEMLYAIGAGPQVKAVDEYSTYPAQAPRTKLSGLQPNLEALLATKPDLVVVDADRNGLRQRLQSLSIPVLVQPAASELDDVGRQLTALGSATGHLAEAQQEDTRIRTQLRRIADSVPRPAKPATYYYELDPTYYSVTSGTFVGRLLATVGLRNIADSSPDAASTGGYPQLSSEYVIKANPDYVFLADTVCCKAGPASVAARPGWAGLTAVKQHHVVGLNDDIASRWGPRIVDLLQAVADSLTQQR